MTLRTGHREVLESLLSVPVAPFHEELVVEQIFRWAHARNIRCSHDRSGNVVLRCGGSASSSSSSSSRRRRRARTWVFTAHMDHPGFSVLVSRGRSVVAEFMGNVGREYFVGSRVRLFGPEGSGVGRIVSVRKTGQSPFPQCRLQLDAPAKLPKGTVGMWDLPDMQLRRGRLITRACDDVVGTAAVLCALEEVVAAGASREVIGLLTRAEEAGFVGALGACRSGTIPQDALVVGIETSKSQPTCPLGSGCVVRVGDKARTFDPSLTAHVTAIADGLSKCDKHFHYTRQLMPGGVCESTPYMLWGYRATALCLPLGNYHNQGRRGRIAPEQVDLSDFANLVKLLVALAADDGNVERTDDLLRRRLRKLLVDRGGYL